MIIFLSDHGLNMINFFSLLNLDIVDIEKYLPTFYISMPS